MKKLLATICALMLMTSFVSCSDSHENNSEQSSSVSESTTEEESTTEPETTTEKPTTIKTTKATTETTTTKATEPTTAAKVKNKKFTFGDLSFELPENCEEHDHEQSENGEYILYELEGPLVLQMTKIFDNSFIDFYYADNETKQFTLENIASSSDTYKDFEKLGEPEIININGEIIAKQEMMTESGSGDIYSTLYVLVYNSDVYTFHFSFLNENDVQSHIMQDKIIESFLFNEDSKISFGEKNALEMAKNYLEIMPFSYNGLIKQLEYEQFTHKEAVYGADNCGADWNQQATDLAQNYIDLMPFSRDELIDQLISEGFTQEQAEYGASSVGY